MNLIFDADDTLWGVEELYDLQRSKFVSLMEQQGLGPGPIVERLAKEMDKQRYAIQGVSPLRFPESLAATYARRCEQLNQPVDTSVAAQVRGIGRNVFTLPAIEYRDVKTTLGKLKSGHVLYLWTQGDPNVQMRRIEQSGLRDLFRDCVVTEEKTTAALQEQIDAWQLEPAETWVVGNSLESDIKPAGAIGLRAVWIPRPVWNEATVLPDVEKDLVYLIGHFAELDEIFQDPLQPPPAQEEAAYLFVSAYHSLYRQYVLDILCNPRDDVIRFPYSTRWVPAPYSTPAQLPRFAERLTGKPALIVFTDERAKGEPRRSPNYLPIRGAIVEKAELHGELLQIEFSLSDYVSFSDAQGVNRQWVNDYDVFIKTLRYRPRLNLDNCSYISLGPSYSTSITTVSKDGDEEAAWQRIAQVVGDLRDYPTFNPRHTSPNLPEVPNPFQYAMFYRISALEDLKTGQTIPLQARPMAPAPHANGKLRLQKLPLFSRWRSRAGEASDVDFALDNNRDYRLRLLFSVPKRPESQVQHSKVAVKFAPDKALVPLGTTEIPLNFSYDNRSIDFSVPRTFEELRASIALAIVPPASISADDPKQPMTPAPTLQIRIKANRTLLGAAAALFLVGGAASTLRDPLSKIIAATVPGLQDSADALSVALGLAGSALTTAVLVYLYRTPK